MSGEQVEARQPGKGPFKALEDAPGSYVKIRIGNNECAPKIAETPVAPVKAKKPDAAAVESRDDLTRISGIGPKLSALLQEKGIDSFAKLASMEAQAIKDLLLSEGSGYSRYDTTTWPDQARELAG